MKKLAVVIHTRFAIQLVCRSCSMTVSTIGRPAHPSRQTVDGFDKSVVGHTLPSELRRSRQTDFCW